MEHNDARAVDPVTRARRVALGVTLLMLVAVVAVWGASWAMRERATVVCMTKHTGESGGFTVAWSPLPLPHWICHMTYDDGREEAVDLGWIP